MLNFLGVFAFERVFLGTEVVKTAAKRPDIDFFSKLHLLLNEFRSRIVNMTTEILFFEKFFEVIRHSDEVELRDPFHLMDSSWMYIPVYQSLLVKIVQGPAHLAEDF